MTYFIYRKLQSVERDINLIEFREILAADLKMNFIKQAHLKTEDIFIFINYLISLNL